MKQETLDFVVEKTNELINSATCCDELKEVANTWLKALGTAQEKKQTEIYLAKLQEDIMPIDGLITFAESEAGKQVFGEEKAKEVAVHGKEIKTAGAKYCDCPACKACELILESKEEMLMD